MTESAIIPPTLASKRGFPSDFTWYYKQASVLEIAGDGDIVLAWDYSKVRNNKPPSVVKSYAFESVADNLVRFLCSTPQANNHCYELVKSGSKVYFDIDKKIAPRSTTSMLDDAGDAGDIGDGSSVAKSLDEERDAFAIKVKAGITEMLADKLPDHASTDFAVLDGSRTLADGTIKLSFHVVLVNLALNSNCDGSMKALAERLKAALGDDAVDLGVYTKHRVFRCPFATKLGDTVGLTPLRSASSAACAQMDDPTFVAKALITNFDMETETIALPVPTSHGNKRPHANDEPSQSSKRRQHEPPADQDYTKLIAALQDLLRKCGDTTTKISGFRKVEINGKLSFTCRNESVRCCLLDPELQVEHDSNQCMIFAEPIDDNFVAQYRCLSPDCPAAKTFRNNGCEIGAVFRAADGEYKVYKGAHACGRIRQHEPPVRQLQPPPSSHHSTSPDSDETHSDNDAGGDDDPTPDSELLEKALNATRVLHYYDKQVVVCMATIAARRPAIAEELRDEFARYYNTTIRTNAASPPAVWGVWDNAAVSPTHTAARALADLNKITKDMEIATAETYVEGVLSDHECPMAIAALCELGNKYDDFRQFFTFDLPRKLPTNPAPCAMEPGKQPIDILREIWIRERSYKAVSEVEFARFVFDSRNGIVLEYFDNFEVRKEDDYQECIARTEKKIREAKIKVKYCVRDEKKGCVEKKPFINRWLEDETTRICDNVVVDPSRKCESNERIFNRWGGIMAEYIKPIPQDDAERLSEPILKHIVEHIALGCPRVSEFLLDWFAHLVQRPDEKTQVAIVLYGTQGSGKSSIGNFMRDKVLGPTCTGQTSRAARDIFGRFSAILREKVFMQIDEVANMAKFMHEVKEIITGAKLTSEEKFLPIDIFRNYSNFMFTTNDPNAFHLEPSDRRMLVIHTNEEIACNIDYFTDLNAAMEHPDAGRAVYQVLMARDLSHIKGTMQYIRPITAFQKELIASCISPEALFMSAIVNAQLTASSAVRPSDKIRISLSNMHEVAMSWITLWPEKLLNSTNIKKFSRNLSIIFGTNFKIRVADGVAFKFSQDEMRALLEKKRCYADDAVMPEAQRAALKVSLVSND